MRRRRAIWPVAALLAVAIGAASGACGVPDSSEPMDRGAAPAMNVREQPSPKQPQGPGLAGPVDLVGLYLQAGAWANVPDFAQEAQKRVREFFAPEISQIWQPGKDAPLYLVRPNVHKEAVPKGNGVFAVAVDFETVGVLTQNGAVEPLPALGIVSSPVPASYEFLTEPYAGGQLRLSNPPEPLMLDVTTLTDWYDARSIYFWDAPPPNGNGVLIPDRRYMAKAMSATKQPGRIVDWLIAGPSSLVRGAAQPLPDIGLKDNVVDNDKPGDSALIINLNSKAANLPQDQLQQLVVQIRWSLRAITASPIDLQIEGVSKPVDGSSAKYLEDNPAVWSANQIDPEKLCVVKGQARPVDARNGRTPAILRSPEVNRDVVAAALTGAGDAQMAALVRADPAGGYRLWLGKLVSNGDLQQPRYMATNLTGRSFSQPVWLTQTTPQRVLVAVNGRLYAVAADGSGVAEVALPQQWLDGHWSVDAVAAAPDNRRLALIAGQQAVIAQLAIAGGGLSLGGYRTIATGLGQHHAIGWTREDRIIVGGKVAPSGSSPLVEVSVDGAVRTPIVDRGPELPQLVVTRLAAYPQDPRDEVAPTAEADRMLVMFEANDTGFNLYGASIPRLLAYEDAASPSASPGGPPVASAPFFWD